MRHKKTDKVRFGIEGKLFSHVGIKLLLFVLFSVSLAHQSALTLETLVWLFNGVSAIAEHANKSGFLDLLLEALLQAVIGFFAVFVSMDCHRVRGA